jgi:DUF1680 family protein
MNTSKVQGFDWGRDWFESPDFPQSNVPNDQCTLWTHGVNNGQAIKAGAVWYRVTGDPRDLQSSERAHHVLTTFHGQATGMFTCDEHLAGLMPSHGTELCTVVETLFSYENLLSATGNVTYADVMERIAYNALPGELTNDMWAHQYLEEVNQYHAGPITGPLLWQTDGPQSIMFGLEPNYGCCTANHDQGWSKFASRLLYHTLGGGLAVAVYAPFSAKTDIGTVTVSTSYPFSDDINITVVCLAEFPFTFRIPTFASGGAKVTTNVGSAAVPWLWQAAGTDDHPPP